MKKTIILFLMIMLVMFNLCACGGPTKPANNNETIEEAKVIDAGPVDFNPSTIKTMGDFYKYKNDEFYNYQDGYTETKYQMAIEINNVYYRATTTLPEGVYEKISQVDFDKKDDIVKELVLPLPVEKFENLNDMIPSQDEINKYVGKTGKELFDEGWTYMYYNVEDVSAGLCYGPFLYDVVFEYNGTPMVNTDDFDFYKEFGDLKVKSIWYTEVGDAIELE